MSRAAQRRREREMRSGARKRGHPAWILVGAAVAAMVSVAIVDSVTGTGSHHPTPRATSTMPTIVPAGRYASYPRAAEAYTIAAAYPSVLDGLYCYCRCREHSGHYSLLDCYASDHASACDICMAEAFLARDMTLQGAPLAEIRDAVDQTYTS